MEVFAPARPPGRKHEPRELGVSKLQVSKYYYAAVLHANTALSNPSVKPLVQRASTRIRCFGHAFVRSDSK